MIEPRVELYIKKALQAGTMPKNDIVYVATIAQVCDMDPMKVQSMYMDASVTLQREFRKLGTGEAADEALAPKRLTSAEMNEVDG